MADIATALRAHLLSKATITNLISTRLYPLVLPAKPTYPSVTYQITEHEHYRHLTGQSGLADALIQFDCYDADPLDLRKDAGIVEQMRLVLLDPDIEHTSVQGIWIESIILASGPIEIYSPSKVAGQAPRYRALSNYRVSYAEAVPT